MDEIKIGAILRLMKKDEEINEEWFTRSKCTKEELDEVVKLGYLELLPRDINDVMSSNRYSLTQKGRNFAWSKE